MAKTTRKRRNFSSFDQSAAFKELGVEKLLRWDLKFKPIEPSKFYGERMRRMERFALTNSERSKELLIDAICEEVIQRHPKLKIWKGALVQSDDLTGIVDYILAPDRAYLDTPLLCVVEAKKDDFEQGMAQCLVEMKACRWRNEQDGFRGDIFGIVSNGEAWRYYKFTLRGKVYESTVYAIGETSNVLGSLHSVFSECERHNKQVGLLK
ncbi:MAG: type I restriction enzyme HsdR N-terminal domain-containing protein [Blastocatellia bacterium]